MTPDGAVSRPRLARPVLLYDGECGFCLTWIARLRRWDRAERIRCLPAGDRATDPALPPIPDAALREAMHLVTPDGRILPGGRALPELIRYLPGGPVLRPLLRLPGVPWITDRVYRWVARRRHRLGCGSSTCPSR